MAIDVRSDVELLHGHPEGFTTLVARHRARMEATARRYLRDDHAARDVCQEILIDLWSTPEQFDPTRGSLSAYLNRLCVSRSIDWIRSHDARRRRELAWTESGPQVTAPPDLLADPAIAAAVDLLPADERTVIIAAFFHQLTHREIAEATGVALGTVKTRIRRGLRRLRTVTALSNIPA